MALVRHKDTKPELRVRRFLHAAGLRYRLHDKSLPGRPDIVFPRKGIVVFVHGCFWHRHSDPACKLARLPKTKLDFWRPKLDGNVERDARNLVALRVAGWRAIIVWECELKKPGMLAKLSEEIMEAPEIAVARRGEQ